MFCAAEGKAKLNEFGVPPGSTSKGDAEAVSSPGTDAKGRDAARAAIDDVADGQSPGEAKQLPPGASDLGSGNAPLGDPKPPTARSAQHRDWDTLTLLRAKTIPIL